jgi:hypothetical protein
MKDMITKWASALSVVVVVLGAAGLVAPKIEAQYASPVRLMNSSAAPGVVSSIDDPGRTAYQSTQLIFTCAGSVCNFNFGTVPAGHRLVIQHAAATFNVGQNDNGLRLVLQVHQSDPIAGPIPISIQIFGNPVVTASYGSGPTQIYLDAGQPVLVDALINAGAFTSGQRLTLIGYLLDCSANSCAPIAQ